MHSATSKTISVRTQWTKNIYTLELINTKRVGVGGITKNLSSSSSYRVQHETSSLLPFIDTIPSNEIVINAPLFCWSNTSQSWHLNLKRLPSRNSNTSSFVFIVQQTDRRRGKVYLTWPMNHKDLHTLYCLTSQIHSSIYNCHNSI